MSKIQCPKADNHNIRLLLSSSSRLAGAFFVAISAVVVHDVRADETSPSSSTAIAEVIVTAQKREERLMDVPVPVSVVNTDELSESGKVLLRDYFSQVPGVNVVSGSGASQQVIIRGIATQGPGKTGVAVTIDGVPFGGTTAFTLGGQLPDIDPGDLERIEVLRGPQGTLYGADSLSGVVNYVTLDPSTDKFGGRVEAGTSGVEHGAQPGFNFRAAANIPLSDAFAVRLSGFERQDPGYVNAPMYGLTGVNETTTYGAHAGALWKASDSISLKVSALYQNSKANGAADVIALPGLGPWDQNYLPGRGGYRNVSQAYSAILKANITPSTLLTVVSSYNMNRTDLTQDWSAVLGKFVPPLFDNNPDIDGITFRYPEQVERYVEEARLTSRIGQFEWQVGGYYSHEYASRLVLAYAQIPATGATLPGTVYQNVTPNRYWEAAGFASGTYHFTDRLSLQVGGRETRAQLDELVATITGSFAPVFGFSTDPATTPYAKSKNNAFTYLVSPSFKLTPDTLLYARLASGFRPGDANSGAPPGIPQFTEPDKTYNYEAGFKGTFLDQSLAIDASVFYIDWKKIPIFVFEHFFGFESNGASADSKGVELSTSWKPVAGLTLGGWVSYDDAVLSKDFPDNAGSYGVSGDRLPFASKWTGTVSADEVVPLVNDVNGFIGGSVSYVGDRLGRFTGAPGQPSPRSDFPSYTRVDLRAGVKSGAWTATLYANNVTNARGIVEGGLGYNPVGYAFEYITPLTVGVSAVYSY